MKRILLLFILITNITLAQEFNNYNFDTQNSDQLVNILEYETGYLLTGYITDSARSITPDFYGAPVLIKLTKTGSPIDTLITTDFGYTELAQTSVYRDGCFYVFGTTNPQNDSIQLVVSKFDTSFNFIEKKIYPQVEGYHYVNLQKTKNETDSSMYFIGSYYDYNTGLFNSFIFKYNFNIMELDKFGYFPGENINYSLMVNDAEDEYTVTANSSSSYSRVITYDSSFVILSDDTLFSTNMPNFTIQSVVNIEEYRDSLYIVLGSDLMDYPLNNPTSSIFNMILQVYNSDFQLQNYKYWYSDSLADIAMSAENALISNFNNDYFLGGTVYKNLFLPSDGLLIVKIDSNLNTLWDKHIDCTAATMCLMNMIPTDDGGVIILYQEQASLGGAELQNSKLMKIGTNGEVTSIIDLGKQIKNIPVSLFPNPAITDITISLEGNSSIKEISLYDVNGKLILQKSINSSNSKINISQFAKGIYIIEGITDGGELFSRKFVKE